MGASSSHPVFVIYKAKVSFFGLNLNIKAKRVKAAELILMADKRQGQALFTSSLVAS